MLNKRFKLIDSRLTTHIFGKELNWDKSNYVGARQSNSIDELFANHKVKDAKPMLNPMSPDIETNLRSEQLGDSNAKQFYILFGGLLYFATKTPPDIYMSVGMPR